MYSVERAISEASWWLYKYCKSHLWGCKYFALNSIKFYVGIKFWIDHTLVLTSPHRWLSFCCHPAAFCKYWLSLTEP